MGTQSDNAQGLVDGRIASLNKLRDAAKVAYIGTASLPTLFRNAGEREVAGSLARLATDYRSDLDSCLNQCRQWLVAKVPVAVPCPGFEIQEHSACEGAAALLFQVAILASETADSSERIPTNADELRNLLEQADSSGFDWLQSAPTDDLQALAEAVDREIDASIRELWPTMPAGQKASSYGDDTKAQPAKPARSTSSGEARAKIIAALTQHHGYDNGSCTNLEPVGVNKLAQEIGVSKSTVSTFFKEQFDGHNKYKVACRIAGTLGNSLKMLNGELKPSVLFSSLGDADREIPDE